MAALARLLGVGLAFGGPPVLEDVDFAIEPGEFVAIVGPSGAGKSTLLRLLAGLARPSRGMVELHTARNPDGRSTALVFQDPRLLPWRRVLGNVCLGLEGLALSPASRRARAEAALATVGLAGLGHRWPHQLSGGQRQRVGLARALAVRPDLLLMDEPFGALDAITRTSLQDDLILLWQHSGSAVLFVTHDINEAVLLGDRVLVLGGAPARIQGTVLPPPRPRDRADPHLQEAGREVRRLLGELPVYAPGDSLTYEI